MTTLDSAGVASWLPGPSARRAGYLLHTSTIYPEATASLLDGGDPRDESVVIRQATEVLERLEQTLGEHSLDLASVARCEVMLASAADFYEFNLVWRRFFADEPPARWTFAVGDTHPLPGARVALHAVAAAGGADGAERTIVTCGDLPDTLEHEHCAQAVVVGDYVFPSPVAAITDYERGIIEAPALLAPAAAQIQTIFERYERLLAEAGASLAGAIKTQNVMASLQDWVHINQVWGTRMPPPPPPRTSISVADLIVPGARSLPNLTAITENQRKEELHAGVRFSPTKNGWQFSAAVQSAEVISLAGHIAVDYATLEPQRVNPTMPHIGSDIEIQVNYILDDRLAILEAQGLGPDSVHEAKVYLKHPRRDFHGFRRAWGRWFSDESGPAVQVIPTTGIHFDHTIVEIELLADRAG